MSLLAFIESEVEARDGSGDKRQAQIAQCPECKNEAFIVFQIIGQDHIHLLCVDCWTSFCPNGQCEHLKEKEKTQ